MNTEQALRDAFVHDAIQAGQDGRLWCETNWLSRHDIVDADFILFHAEQNIEKNDEGFRVNWFKVLEALGYVNE